MRKVLLLAMVLMFTLVSIPAFSQENTNLSGTWEGTIYIADIDIEMELTLVLEEKNGTLSGKMTDDWGFINCAIKEPKHENNVLTFKALVETASDDHEMAFRMTAAKTKMEGQWESLGTYGSWTAVKQNEDEEKSTKGFNLKDMVGTWEGPAAFKTSPGSKRILTLVLVEKDEKLHGTFSDEAGTNYTKVEITNFDKDNFIFVVTFQGPGGEYTMDMNMTQKAASLMKGKFKIPKMNREGIWKAEKK